MDPRHGFSETIDCVVVGAGIAGLAAAGALSDAGFRVIVVEKSRGVGGRMATRRVGAAVCDHGAQFFTVRGAAFGSLVQEAQGASAVATWCDGFARAATVDAPAAPAADGHPRWRGMHGMTDLPKWLAARLPPERCGMLPETHVAAVGLAGTSVRIGLEIGPGGNGPTCIEAAAAIVTTPVPQSLSLFEAGGLAGDPAVSTAAMRQLAAVAYDPCFALLLVLDRPSLVPPSGGVQFAAGPIAWIADNQQKGISPVPALTVHASGDFSRRHFDRPPDEVAALIVDLVRRWIPGDPEHVIVERSLQRWKYALPTTTVPAAFVQLTDAPPIVCCGDAFDGPRVEGAAASGLAAGQRVARCLEGGGGGDG